MPLPFNASLDHKLLALVKDNPILYNTRHSKYLDFDSREVVWQKIGDVLNRPALEFAAIQCQIHHGDFQEEKHKPGLIENLNEYLPEQYSSSWGIEKKILKRFSELPTQSQIEAKYLYTKVARDLPTYGVTFFLVKEKQKGKKKLVPRLLGISSEAILRLDEVTKEILQVWPLTQVKTYHAGKKDTFTLNFGEYSEKEYSVKTNDALRIRDILEGYIDIIRKRMGAPYGGAHPESAAIYHDHVEASRGNTITHVVNNPSKVMEQSYVGPSQIIQCEQGSRGQQGVQITTVQQMIITNKGSTQQQAVSGEVPVRRDMTLQFVKKLNRMNSNSVKIVTALTDPTEENVREARRIVEVMEADMPSIIQGVIETADKQTSEDARKKLLGELEELRELLAALSMAVERQDLEPEHVQDPARRIADLTTQMYFSLDPRTKRRSALVSCSRASFIADEKSDSELRRASFLAAAATACGALHDASHILDKEYQGRSLSDQDVEELEAAASDKLGKLNAAVALFLTAHSDPKDLDYSAAITSMNTINELMPELAKDAKALSNAKGGSKQALHDEILMKALCDAARRVCALTGTDDHEKIQEAASEYADVSGKLIYTFGKRSRRTNSDKENEIIDLSKDVGDATTVLLMKANELTTLAESERASGDVDSAGVRCADAARDLLACAQLTAPSIHEPHCQSALTAAAESLSSSAQHLATTWKPLVEDPARHQIGEELKTCTMELAKALDRLRDAYANLSGADDSMVVEGGGQAAGEDGQRLRFVAGVCAAQDAVRAAAADLDKPIVGGVKLDAQQTQDQLSQKMAQINAAVASLLQAKSDPANPDYSMAELAVSTICELMPDVIRDTKALSSTWKDDIAQQAVLNDVRAWCDAVRGVCASAGHAAPEKLEEAALQFAKASRKLSFVFSPRAHKAREQLLMELCSSAHNKAMQLVSDSDEMAQGAGGERLAESRRAVSGSARALRAVAQLTAPSIAEPRCQAALLSSTERLTASVQDLVSESARLQDHETGCSILEAKLDKQRQEVHRQGKALQQELKGIKESCRDVPATVELEDPGASSRRLKFIASTSTAQQRVQAAGDLLNEPVAPAPLPAAQAAALEAKLAHEMALVNAAIAALLQAQCDQKKPDYGTAEQCVANISELMPAVINDARALSASCADAGARRALLGDVRAWSEAVRGVCAGAGQDNAEELNNAALDMANVANKLTFVINPRKNTPKEKQVVHLSDSACGKAQQMVAEAEKSARAAGGAAGTQLAQSAADVVGAARALRTATQLTAPSIHEPRCQSALLSSADGLSASARELVSAARQLPGHGALAGQLGRHSEEMERALDGLREVCADGAMGSASRPAVPVKKTGRGDAPEDPAARSQRLKYIAGASVAQQRVKEAEGLLSKPVAPAPLPAAQAAALEAKLAHEVALVNAAIAALLQAQCDQKKPDYGTAEQSVANISELMPAVINDARALSASCADAGARRALLGDVRAWSEAVRSVCAGAGQDNAEELNNAALDVANVTNKLTFVINPRKNTPKEKQVAHLSDSACGKAQQMVAEAEKSARAAGGAAGTQLAQSAADVAGAARALRTATQLTAPSIHEPRCQSALLSSADGLSASARELVSAARQLPGHGALAAQLGRHSEEMERALDGLREVCADGAKGSASRPAVPVKKSTLTGRGDAPEDTAARSQRLKYIAGASVAQQRVKEAEGLLSKPVAEGPLPAAQAAALEAKLAHEVALVNAAIAALLQAQCDQKKPDYGTAEQCVANISELMPAVINDARALSATCADAGARRALLGDVRAWSEAVRGVCAGAGQDSGKDLEDAAVTFANVSNKLVFVTSPRKNVQKEKQVAQLSDSACGKAQQMVAEAEKSARAAGGAAGTQLAQSAADVAGAARALRTATQLTAPSIHEPRCQSALLSSADGLSASARELVSAARQLPGHGALAGQLGRHSEEMERALDGLREVCADGANGSASRPAVPVKKSTLTGRDDAPEDPAARSQRLKYIAGASVAQQRVKEAEQLLSKPVAPAPLPAAQAAALEAKLAHEVALVNAAIAALLQAQCDQKKPDYGTAEQCVANISELMPAVINDVRALSATCADAGARQALLGDVRAWSEAVRGVCAGAGQDNAEELNNAALDMANVANELTFVINPRKDTPKEKQVAHLSDSACVKAQQMVAEAEKSARAAGGAAGTQLAQSAADVAGAARALRTATQLTAPSIHEPRCQSALLSSADGLSASARELVSAARQLPGHGALAGQLGRHSEEMERALDGLREVCADGANGSASRPAVPVKKSTLTGRDDAPEDPAARSQRLKYIAGASVAQQRVKEAEGLLSKPVAPAPLQAAQSAALEAKLAHEVALVNAAIAALLQAQCDQKKPDYGTAEQSVANISELMPAVINDARALSATCADAGARRALLGDVRAWSEAVRGVCAGAGQDSGKDLEDAAVTFANVSNKLVFVTSPRKNVQKEKQVAQLSDSACGKAQQMVAEAEKSARAAGGAAGTQLAQSAADVAGAARALRTATQLTAPSIHEPRCQSALLSSADGLSASARELVSAARQLPGHGALAGQLGRHSEEMERALDGLREVCADGANGSASRPAVPVKKSTLTGRDDAPEDPAARSQRLKYIAGASVAQQRVKEAEQLLSKPVAPAPLPAAQAAALEAKLAHEVALVNAAIAALLQAQCDQKKPDYGTAEQSVANISELMPAVINDARALSASCADAGARRALLGDVRAWSEAVRGVCAGAGQDSGDFKELEDAALASVVASNKLTFVTSSKENMEKEKQVMRLVDSVFSEVKEMVVEAPPVARAAGGAAGAQLARSAVDVVGAARALRTAAQLTAPSIHEPRCQSALLSSADGLSASARELVSAARQLPEHGALADQLGRHSEEMERALDGLREVCADGAKGSASRPAVPVKKSTLTSRGDAPEDPAARSQRLKYIAGASVAQQRVKEAEGLLSKPVAERPLPAAQAAALEAKLAHEVALVNAAIAALLQAQCDQKKPDYGTAEQSVANISELMPAVINDARALSATCADAGARQALLGDVRAWSEAVRGVCAGAGQDSVKDLEDAAVTFANVSNKSVFVTSPRKNVQKEKQVAQLSASACGKAQQMVAEAEKSARAVGGAAGTQLAQSAADVAGAARALRTATQLTAPSIHEPRCQSALLSSADGLSASARELVSAARQLPGHGALADQLGRHSEEMERALDGLREVCADGAKGSASRPAVPVKKSTLTGRGGATPARDVIRVSHHAAGGRDSQDFLHQLRCEESQDRDENAVAKKAEEEKRKQQLFFKTVGEADKSILKAEEQLKVVQTSKASVPALDADQSAAVQKQMEKKLALAGSAAAALVASNHPGAVDHAAASELTRTLSKLIPDIVKDASLLSNSREEKSRRLLLSEILALCEATRKLCGSVESDPQKLRTAAAAFGDKSAQLLYIISTDVDPTQEKEVISRAKAIGDSASRLAMGGAGVAMGADGARAQGICDAGRQCADAAGAFVYTAKLVAPSIQHPECQNSLISASNNLSSHLKTFTSTWKPLASEPQQAKKVAELIAEAANLEKILEDFRQDLGAGKLVKRREVEKIVVEDTPLRQLAYRIMEDAKNRAESSAVAVVKRRNFAVYATQLADAIRTLDVANSRCHQSPEDLNKRKALDNAVRNLQLTLLQSRPTLGNKPQNNVVDLTDFVQDVLSEVENLRDAINKTNVSSGQGLEGIKAACEDIKGRALERMNPSEQQPEDATGLDDILEFDHFGQECEKMIKDMNSTIHGLQEKKTKEMLQDRALPLAESCNLLRFASKSALASAQGAALDETLADLDDLEKKLDKMLQPGSDKKAVPAASSASMAAARARLCAAAAGVARGAAHALPPALGSYVAESRAHTDLADAHERAKLKEHLSKLVRQLRLLTVTAGSRVAQWQPAEGGDVAALTQRILKELEKSPMKSTCADKPHVQVLNEKDLSRLLLPPGGEGVKIAGHAKQVEEKLQQTATQLTSLSGTLLHSVGKPESLARSAHTAADVAATLAATARALKTNDPVHNRRIEEATQEMCFATYQLLKIAELVSQEPAHPGARRRLLDACGLLNNSINKLARRTSSNKKQTDCSELSRSLQAQQNYLQSAQPSCALSYAECEDALGCQQYVVEWLKSEEPMSREQFAASLLDVVEAASHSANFAAHAAYLLSISEQHKEVAKTGLVDVARVQQLVSDIQESGLRIMRAGHVDQVKEDEEKMYQQVQELQQAVKEASARSRDAVTKREWTEGGFKLDLAARTLHDAVGASPGMDKVSTCTMSLLDATGALNSVVDRPAAPAPAPSADTKAMADELMDNSKKLLSTTQALVKEVRAGDDDEPMTWVTFGAARGGVLRAFEALLASLRQNGQRAGLIELPKEEEVEEDPDAPKKSFVQMQVDVANKWLQRRPSKPELQSAGERAARNVIHIAQKMTEDLKGNEREDMKHLITESEHLLSECSEKYDNDKASALMDSLREMRKAIERGVVSRVVEDFIEAEAPFADLEVFADAERDETKRKFLLERKIAELLAQLGRVTRTARLVADASGGAGRQLAKCSDQVELLAPMLVKAAQERVSRPDDERAADDYRALLAQYAASLSQVRDLCDQAVDPMDFVQTAGETMQKMREESSQHNDPQRCAYTSTAITRLANRVIHVGMSSSGARADPELLAALAEAQQRLSAATPAPHERASRLPDWRDTTAEILRTTGEVESVLGGENIFKKEPDSDQPIYNAARDLHAAVREWSARDNEIVGVAKRMAVLMARLSDFMNNDKNRDVLSTSKSIVTESHEVALLARKLALECSDMRIRTNLLQVCERIPTISGQLKMLTTVKGSSLGQQGTDDDKEAMNMLVGNAQNLMMSVQEVVKVAASASVKIASQRRGPRMRWVRRNFY